MGGFDFGNGNTGKLAAEKLKKLYPKLKIAGINSGSKSVNHTSLEEEEEIINEINKANPDLLYIAYGPVSQENGFIEIKIS